MLHPKALEGDRLEVPGLDGRRTRRSSGGPAMSPSAPSRSAGWPSDPGPSRARPQRIRGRTPTRPQARKPPRRRAPLTPGQYVRRRFRRRLRVASALASALVIVATGAAWGLYRDVTAGITTTDVIADGADGGAQNILLVGLDSRTDAHGDRLPQELQRVLNSGPDTGVLNTDTIILLHVPEGGGATIAFSIPRDAYVSIPGLPRDKINAAYPKAKARAAERLEAEGVRDEARIEAESAQAGRSTLIRTVENLTDQSIDHYAEINLLGFHNLTTAVGGVDVCLRAPVNDPLSGARFPAGPQTISGADALAFVRQRHGLPDGDLSRIRRQQVFLAAVADKILSSGTLTDPRRLAGLVEVAQRSLVIDEGWNLLDFARQAADVAAGNLRFVTIPTDGSDTNTRGDVVLVDPRSVETFVGERIAEHEQAAEAAGSGEEAPPAPPALDIIASRYVVDVHNGSDLVGMAAAVSRHLQDLGFAPGVVDNTVDTRTSVVRYTEPDGDAARELAEQLGGLETETDGSVVHGHLHVVLGADFDPGVVPTSPTRTPAPTADPEPAAPITAEGVVCVD
jgi:LCP family protein required for cell wall assembly